MNAKRRVTPPQINKTVLKTEVLPSADCSECDFGQLAKFALWYCNRKTNRQITPQPNVKKTTGVCYYFHSSKDLK